MIEEGTPQNRSHIAVEKEMIYGLPSLLTHIAFVYHDNMSFPEVIQGENLAKNRDPHKEGNP